MNVLFVGNSYTFYNDMPQQVAGLAEADPEAPEIQVERVVRGGATLRDHARDTEARERIADPRFTHVVLQEKSTGPLHDAKDYHEFVRRLGELATRRGAALLLYETWARKAGHAIYRWGWSGRRPSTMRTRVRAQLEKAAADLGASIVPVGTAFEVALERDPRRVLHDTDGHHASPLGSHLAASVFYGWLTGRDPTPLSFDVPEVPPDEAREVRAVAWDVVRAQRST